MSKKIQTKKKQTTKAFKKSDFVEQDINLLPGSRSVLLYRFVYSSLFSFVTAFLILTSFLLQGVEMAYANEDLPELETQNVDVADSDQESVMNVESELGTEESIQINDEELLFDTNFSDTIESEDSTNVIEDNQSESEILMVEISSSTEDSTEESFLEATTSEDLSDTSNLETPSGDSDNEVNNENESEGEVVIDEEQELLPDTVSSTSEEVVLETDPNLPESIGSAETVSITQSDSAFSFTKDECTQLATGSFYCLKPQVNDLKDALFSAPDADGDLEIYFVKDGLQVQVTQNTNDDAAPYYDQNTNKIVWHRLINDRYQIVLYDIETQKETILTDTSSNNMEPTSQGDYVVWQRWIDGGWNIILFDGQKEQQLTKTTGNNVAPYIHGSLVVWNRHDSEGKKTIEIYNIDSKTYVTVDDPDGLSVSNPRMVFVYDSLAPNGDVVTKGYDVLAKKFIELDSLPRELPEEIPTSESTGETRALIQSKPSPKSDLEEITGNASSTRSGAEPPNQLPNVSATTTDALTLDLSSASSSQFEVENAQTISDTPVVEVDLSEFELVIEAFTPPIEASSTEAVQE